MTSATAAPTAGAEVGFDGGRAFRLWNALLGAHAALTAGLEPDAETCAAAGIDVVSVLLPLAQSPEQQLRMHELAERSHLSPSGLTRRVDRLERDGLVRRASCPSDRRGAWAVLLPAGRDVLEHALPHHVRLLGTQVASRLTEAETEQLVELLERLAAER